MLLGYIYTFTFMWPSSMWLKYDLLKHILMPGVNGVWDSFPLHKKFPYVWDSIWLSISSLSIPHHSSTSILSNNKICTVEDMDLGYAERPEYYLSPVSCQFSVGRRVREGFGSNLCGTPPLFYATMQKNKGFPGNRGSGMHWMRGPMGFLHSAPCTQTISQPSSSYPLPMHCNSGMWWWAVI